MNKLKILLKHNYIIIICFFLLIIRLFTYIYVFPHKSIYNINDNTFSGVITRIRHDNKYISFDIKNKEIIRCIYYEKDFNYKYGDYIKVSGKLNIPNSNTNINQFNYKKYLYYKNIFYILEVESINKIEDNTSYLYKIKNNIINRINKYKDKSKNYLNAFILGNNSNIEDNIQDSYKTIGISHLFAISGMHVSIFTMIVLFILKRVKPIFKYTVLFIILLIYLFILELSSSALRSIIFFIILNIVRLFNKDKSTTKIYLYSLILIMFIKPFIIYDIGFIYSSIISLYLIVFKKLLIKKNYIYKLFLISLIAFLVSLPITIYNYYLINILSVLFNIFLVPFISIIVFPLSILVFIFPFLEEIYLILINILEFVINLFNSINSNIILKRPSIIFIILYYLLISLILSKIKKIYIISLILLLLVQYNYNYIFKSNYLIMLDVKQGDSFIFHSNNKTFMIDTGYYNKKDVLNVLKSLGIRKLDYLFITHGDYDHIGNSNYLINNIKINEIILNNYSYNNNELNLINNSNIKCNRVYKDNYSIGDYKLHFLDTKDYLNENDNSSVIYIKINNIKMLFMGDAGIKKEKDILNKYSLNDIDILKVGHHGSYTSSSKEFINSIKPNTCLISVGQNNRYGHPNETVLDTLKSCSIYRTDYNGAVKININKNNYNIKIVK